MKPYWVEVLFTEEIWACVVAENETEAREKAERREYDEIETHQDGVEVVTLREISEERAQSFRTIV